MKAIILLLIISGCGEVYLNPPDLGASVDASPALGARRSDSRAEDGNVIKEASTIPETHPLVDADALSEKPPKPAECQDGALVLTAENPCEGWCSVVEQRLVCP